jgi:hypothetical protein
MARVLRETTNGLFQAVQSLGGRLAGILLIEPDARHRHPTLHPLPSSNKPPQLRNPACREGSAGYELAAPVPGTINTAPAIEFMRGVRELVRVAVEENGGTMLP